MLYDIMASCVKMFKNGNAGCTSITTKEPCCIGARDQYVQAKARSLELLASSLGSQTSIRTDDRGTQELSNWYMFGRHVEYTCTLMHCRHQLQRTLQVCHHQRRRDGHPGGRSPQQRGPVPVHIRACLHECSNVLQKGTS